MKQTIKGRLIQDEPASVYRYYDSVGILIYVGITSRATLRNRQHNRDKSWWPNVVRQEVDHYPSRALALTHEADLIRRHRPPFNVALNRDWRVMRTLYEQYRESNLPSLGPDLLLKSVYRRIALDCLTHDPLGSHVEFATPVNFASIACRLTLKPNQPVIALPRQKVVGQVDEIVLSGPSAKLIVRHLRKGVTWESARAYVRHTAPKDGDFFYVKAIELIGALVACRSGGPSLAIEGAGDAHEGL